jgi:hypothetical protein
VPHMYPATVRRQIVARLRSGPRPGGIAQATLFRWKRQALIDAGVIEARVWRPTSWPPPMNASPSSRMGWR